MKVRTEQDEAISYTLKTLDVRKVIVLGKVRN